MGAEHQATGALRGVLVAPGAQRTQAGALCFPIPMDGNQVCQGRGVWIPGRWVLAANSSLEGAVHRRIRYLGRQAPLTPPLSTAHCTGRRSNSEPGSPPRVGVSGCAVLVISLR